MLLLHDPPAPVNRFWGQEKEFYMLTRNKSAHRSVSGLPSIEQIRAERQRIKYRADYRKALLGTVQVLIVAAAAAVLVSTLLFPVLQITGTSMEPSLKSGDILLLFKSRNFEPGDICGFSWNNRTLVKRVIGVPGDWIEIDRDGTVYRNGEALSEPYISKKSLGECDLQFPCQVPDHCLFLLGDQRETSIDSRSSLIGSVDSDRVVGKAIFRVWPLQEIGLVR